VHLEFGEADEETWAGVVRLVLLVVTDDVADVLAHEALNALAELLAALDVDLLHAVPASGGGAGSKAGTFFAISKLKLTSVTRSRMIGNARMGATVTGPRGAGPCGSCT